MSTMLEGQLVAWRTSARPRDRASLVEAVRVAVIVVAIAAAAIYLATMSQTPAVVSGLVSEARARPVAASSDLQSGGIEVTLRPSARNARPLLP